MSMWCASTAGPSPEAGNMWERGEWRGCGHAAAATPAWQQALPGLPAHHREGLWRLPGAHLYPQVTMPELFLLATHSANP